jgi:MATE family multidrug resistance protein
VSRDSGPITTQPNLTYRRVVVLAAPIILANLAVPLLGLVDTAVIGNLGRAAPLAAIAIGSQVFNFLYWGMGFLRMGTTGLTAQADGGQNEAEVRAVLARSILLALAIGCVLVVTQRPVVAVSEAVFQSTPTVAAMAREYILIRIWGAPATLVSYVALGWFIGLQKTRIVLVIQIFLNTLNIVLDVLFVVGFGWAVPGVAVGTLISEWSAALLALALIGAQLRRRAVAGRVGEGWRSRVFDGRAVIETIDVNRDIFLRTVLLIAAFAWFTRQGALAGETILAANHVLLQFLTLSAFFLDGFAFSTEALVGQAVGSGSRSRLTRAVRLSTVMAVATAAVTSVLFAVLGGRIIDVLTSAEEVRTTAHVFLVYAVMHPLVGVWCFQLDGIFIGATQTADMRNTMVVSFAIYIAVWWALWGSLGNHGLWIALITFFVARGLTLAARYPSLVRGTP